jgi:serine/threonine protein kinase
MSTAQPTPPEDDDRTLLPTRQPQTRAPATTLTAALPPAALPAGEVLAEFVIEGCIGEGGFGIVYRAHDTQLERTVAIKEYMPASLAMRGDDGCITLRSERHRETFELGLKSFINEARLLAAFDHPALLKVYRFWEANGTAYMVMPCYEGVTLKEWLRRAPQPPDEAWWRERLPPLLDALALMHSRHCYHRDVAPDNIMLIGPALQPLLLDFGAARRVIGDATQALTVILKPGYAPVEQYAEVAALKQGPWTDVYALCAVLYTALTGAPPPPSVGRMVKDECVPARVCAAGRYSEAFLAAIDAGLSIRPEDRPQDMLALGAALGLSGPAAAGPIARTTAGHGESVDLAIEPRTRPGPPTPPAVSPGAVPGARPPAPAPARRPWLLLAGAAVLAAGLGAAVLGLRGRSPAAQPDLVTPASSVAVSAVASAAPQAPAQAAASEAPGAAPGPTAVAARGAYEPVAVLRELLDRADPSIGVEARADLARVVIDRDRLQFRLHSSVAGFVYVLFVGTDGRELRILFPNAIDADNRLRAGQEIVLPRPKWRITAGGPPGADHVLVLVSPQPRRFESVGARLPAGESMPVFDLDTAQRVWRSSATAAMAATPPPFAGEPACAQAPDCDRRYGAALLRIEEVAASRP